MKTPFTATAPATYTNSSAATLTVAAMLGLAAGAKIARVWDTDAATSPGRVIRDDNQPT